MPARRSNMFYHISEQIGSGDGITAGKIFEVETEISSAQIKLLATTAIDLVEAPGPDKVLEFVGAILKHNAGTAYAEPSAPDDMVIEYSGGQDVTASIDATGFLDQITDEIRLAPPSTSAMAITVDLEALKNTSLRLLNTGGNYTTGTGSLNVRVSYRVHDFN